MTLHVSASSVLWKQLPASLEGLPAQPAVTEYLIRQYRQNLARVSPEAFAQLPLPRYRTTPDMIQSILHFDIAEHWRSMRADRWGEHQTPDLPAYQWAWQDRPGFRDYYRSLRPFNAQVLMMAIAARFEKDVRCFEVMANRAREFSLWCQSDECSIWAGDYDLGEIIEAFLHFFDMCVDRLSDAQREDYLDGFEAFAKKLREVLELFRLDEFPYDSHVLHQAVAYAGLSVVLHSHGRATGTQGLEFWANRMAKVYPCFGGADGGYAQGTAYWKWALPPALNAAQAMRDLGFVDLLSAPYLANTGYFKWYMQPPYARCGGFGDHPNMRALPLDFANMRLLGMLLGKDDLIGYADHFQPLSGMEYDGGPDSSNMIALMLLLKTWKVPAKAKRPVPSAPSRVFHDVGLVASHSALGDAQRDVMVCFRSSPYGSFNHAHADQNSFIAEAYGQPIFINAGYYPDYHHPHMKGFSIQTMAHNTVLLNNQGQAIRNMLATGCLEHTESGKSHDYMIGECAQAYPSNPSLVRRHLWFERGAANPWMLIVDHVILKQPGNVDFLLHSYEEPQWDSARREAEFFGWRYWGQTARARVQFLGRDDWYWHQSNEFPYPADGREMHQPRQWHARATTTRYAYEQWLLVGIVFGQVEARSPLLAPAFVDARPRLVCKEQQGGWEIRCGATRLHVDRQRDRVEVLP